MSCRRSIMYNAYRNRKTPYPLVFSTSNHRSPLLLGAYFLPDFLMPWEPVFSGPLPLPTLPASSSRAFLSVRNLSASVYCLSSSAAAWCVGSRKRNMSWWGRKWLRTGSELGLVCEVILVEFLRLLLGLLVVDRVGTGCWWEVSAC
jgi:hypothetical protein